MKESTLQPDTKRSAYHKFLLCCGLIGSILFIALYFIEAALAEGYSSYRQAISDLEKVKYGWMQSANFIQLGVFICLFAAGLKLELKNGLLAFWLPFFQCLVALGLILSGLFIHDPFHTIASMIAFIPLVISFFLFAGVFYGDPRWRGWMTYSIISAIAMMVFLALFGMTKTNGGPSGLFERLAAGVRSLWSLFFTIRLLKGVRLTQPERKSIH